jgi:hypothetical protein
MRATMLLYFNNDPVNKTDQAPKDLPFQPGEVFMVRYMGLPTIVTVQRRTEEHVKVWFNSMTAEEFNQRILVKLGKRARFLGFWLPVVVCEPTKVFAHGLAKAFGDDFDFWANLKPRS